MTFCRARSLEVGQRMPCVLCAKSNVHIQSLLIFAGREAFIQRILTEKGWVLSFLVRFSLQKD